MLLLNGNPNNLRLWQGRYQTEKEPASCRIQTRSIGASTRIENAVLTDQEIEWLDTTLHDDGKPTAYDQMKQVILNKLSKDKERSIEEVTGCRTVLSTVYM